MNYISLKNIRSLKDTGKIELAPLTVLLGKNSSGKSTFLRMFPLFKQSWNNKNMGALALYGDFVDFGDFNLLKTTGAKSRVIEIGFDIEVFSGEMPPRMRISGNDKKQVIYQCVFGIRPLKNSDILHCPLIKIKSKDVSVLIRVSQSGKPLDVVINRFSYKTFLKDLNCLPISTVFPSFVDAQESGRRRPPFFYPMPFTAPLEKRLGLKTMVERFDLFHLKNMLTFAPKQTFINHLSAESFGEFGKILSKSLKSESGDACYNDLLFAALPHFLDMLGQRLCSLGRNIYYSKPLRANAERYYRIQSLATEEIAPDGSNLISFISNMGSAKSDFDEWTKNNLGFIVYIHKEQGHQSIFLREDGAEYNVTDMGFGFSQMIPILVQLWDISKKQQTPSIFRSNEFIYAVEQPELHLHPALQAKVVKLFCDVLKIAEKNKIKLRIILETHSETIVNYLGKLVAAKMIEENKVRLLIFEKAASSHTTSITESTYTKDGVLQNWPFGFFSTRNEI